MLTFYAILSVSKESVNDSMIQEIVFQNYIDAYEYSKTLDTVSKEYYHYIEKVRLGNVNVKTEWQNEKNCG